jgi:thioesterase domain-containing protein/acyl carrier protein
LKKTIRVAFQLLLLSFFLLSGHWVYVRLLGDPCFRVREVEVEGSRKIPKETLLSLMVIDGMPNLFSVKLKEVVKRLESHPWIEQVRVRKVFPHKILIQIEEKKPMAIIQLEELYYIDTKGEIFSPVGDRDEYNYPYLTGLSRRVLEKDPVESKRLIAYYTLKTEEDAPAASELRQLLQKALPEHMLPGFFVCLNAFPLTPNGKIDRAALPAPQPAQTAGEQYAAPRTAMEQTLAGIWQQVLAIPRVGIHDNFFEIGGHSLLVVRLTALIRQAVDVELPVTELYKYPTVAELAAQLTRITSDQSSLSQAESSASPLIVLSARGTGTPLVLIPGIAGVLPAYYDLAQAVGEMRSVYGLHALSAQEAAIPRTVENIAQLYVSSLLDFWDKGPIHILGHSYGGLLAFEMVCQLEQQGRDVDSLILVDSDPFALQAVELPPNVFILRYMGDLLHLDDAAIEEATKRLELAGVEQVVAFLHDLAFRCNAGRWFDRDQIYQWVCTIQSRYINRYVPAGYRPTARVLKIWGEDGAVKEVGDLDAAWQQILQKETDRLVVPGDHETLMRREYAPGFGRLLNDWIEKNDAKFFERNEFYRLGN